MHAEVALTKDALARRWREILADPRSPDFCELNEQGELIVNPPPSPRHQNIGLAVIDVLRGQLGPKALYDVAVVTHVGVLVPDVVWMPPARWAQVSQEGPLPFAPDLCVEILSPSNTSEEIARKVDGYLRAGAREVIVVGLKGEVELYGPEGRRVKSAIGVELALPPDLF